MAISTYGELKTAIENWLGGRTDQTSRVPEWISQAEDRIAQELEALVVGHLAVLVRERPVRQGMGQQLRVEIRNSQDGAELVRAGLSGAVLVHDGVGQELREPDDARRGRRTGRTRGTRGAG